MPSILEWRMFGLTVYIFLLNNSMKYFRVICTPKVDITLIVEND